MTTRPEGFYWVKRSGQPWTVLQWSSQGSCDVEGKGWSLVGEDLYFSDEQLMPFYLSPRLEPPTD